MSDLLSIVTFMHVAISLVGIASGIVVLLGLLDGHIRDGWTTLFLSTTLLTSISGFAFPFTRLLPSHVVGVLSLAILASALYARYRRQLAGGWCTAYVLSAVAALYLDIFVAVVQSFQKISALQALAPTQSEPFFVGTQAVVLLLCIVLATMAAIRCRKRSPHHSQPLAS